MSDLNVIKCDKCDKVINVEDPFWCGKVLFKVQDRKVAEQTRKDLEVWAKVDLCAECSVTILREIIKSKFSDAFDLARTLESYGVNLFDFTEG